MDRDLTTSANESGKTSEEGNATISEISDSRMVEHLYTGFSPTPILSAVDDSLPYHQLGGQGFERLCYSIISSRGGVPRYFGNTGQEQYGIDLIVTDSAGSTVYQCKNVSSFTCQNMRKVLQLFEEKWLGHAQLPRPTTFVVCCTLPLRELKLNEGWTILEQEFFNRTGVRIVVWDKEYLDAQLRNLPDVVADLFSDQTAERFCGLADWNEDLFRPVQRGSGEPTVARYLEKKVAGQIYLDAHLIEDFTRKLERHSHLLILGLPGSGKTTTGLALAAAFRQGLYRLFYINMRRDLSEDALVRGIRRRLARPTIFLIDDCHGKYDEILEGMHDRLQEVLARQPGRAMLIYVARTTPTPKGLPRADYTGFVEEFKKADAVLEFHPTPELFASIAALSRPDLRELSAERLERIFSVTGRDLFLLDHLLDTVKSPDEIDQLQPEHLFERALVRYFGQPTGHFPGFMMLTALAQFEIAPAVSEFPYDLQSEGPKAAAQLVVGAGHPMRYFFLHSSAAELIFRALALNYRIDNYVEAAAFKLIEFFKSRQATDPQFLVDLTSVVRNRLKLRVNEEEEYLLKSRFLSDDRIYTLVEAVFDRLSLNTVALLLSILKSTDVTTFERYHELVRIKIEDGTVLQNLMASFPSQFMQLVKNEYPSWYSNLREQFADQGLRQLVRTREIRNLLKLMVSFAGQEDFILGRAIDSVSDEEFDGLIGRSIASGRSIGTLDLWLRELKKIDPDLLRKLEQKVTAKRLLHLMTALGTILELFMMFRHVTPLTAAELIEGLDDETVDTLVDRTISMGRSIATVHLGLRVVKETDSGLLMKLERKIGAQRYLRLIAIAGTIVELFKVMQYSSASMAVELVKTLDDKTVNDLIERTITSGRSIGTLDLVLRDFKSSDPDTLDMLERGIGIERWWKLILANGKLITFTSLMKRMDDTFRQEMVQASQRLTIADWEKLLLRGTFNDLTIAVRWRGLYFPKLFTPALIKPLSPVYESLIRKADWSALCISAYRLSESPDSPLNDYLQSLLNEHVAKTEIASLRFDTFDEAARCISLLSQKMPSKRDELSRLLFSILPNEDAWYRDVGFLRTARVPLNLLLRSPPHQENDQRMLDLCNSRNIVALFARSKPLDILLYLWNLYSLWFKCERVVKQEMNTSFADFLDPEVHVSVKRILDEQLRSRVDGLDNEHLVSLCGFLYASGLADFSEEVKAEWLSGLWPFDELLDRAEGMESFLVASFFLVGLGWIFDRGIPRPVFSRVISKASSYEDPTPAFNNLYRLLKRRIR